MSSAVRLVGVAAFVGVLLVGRATSAPDMFTALVDMQRALTDEQSAAFLMKQYVTSERQRLHELERYKPVTATIIISFHFISKNKLAVQRAVT